MLPDRFTSKPQYILHPTRALRRMGRLVSKPRPGQPASVARLPWGLDLKVHASDAIGYSILVGRVFDPCGPSYLATADPSRSIGHLAVRGWTVGGIGLRRAPA
jgi:hypothetical protein